MRRKPKLWCSWFLFFGFALGAVSFVVDAGTAIQHIRLSRDPQKTRLVLDASSAVKYQLKPVSDQIWKLVIFNGRVLADLTQVSFRETPIQVFKVVTRNASGVELRLVLEQDATLKSFTLGPQKTYGHRLVLDVYPRRPLKPFIIAIDAGHGGGDPGAIGKRGTLEKDIALSVAKLLRDILAEEPEIKPVMVREGDYYLTLRQRIARARKAKADLFVSIHADSGRNPYARGSSVYVLSERGASSEAARWLAHRENQSDLMGEAGGVSLKHRDELVASVLLDLSMTAKMGASLEVGNAVLENLSTINRLHKPQVEYAGFVVLKSPDIPSILVETAFLSNTQEEKKLKNKEYQRMLAASIARGLKHYIKRQRVRVRPGQLLAESEAPRPTATN